MKFKRKFKRLLCKIFGHRLGKGTYETVEYVRMGNYGKKSRKKKVVRTFRKCKLCGAMIMVGKQNKY